MVVGFVLLKVEGGRENEVEENLSKKPYIQESHTVTGPYDVIAKMEAVSYDDLKDKFNNEIKTMDGVKPKSNIVTEYQFD